MLQNTFCHIPGIGLQTESRLWSSGIESWDAYHSLDSLPLRLSGTQKHFLSQYIRHSRECLEKDDFLYFAGSLPSTHHWRFFPNARHSIAYLDIETDGLTPFHNTITTIALYDGKSVFHYVKGRNLEAFVKDIRKYNVIVTYNGKTFDVPFIQNYFRIKMPQAHIDLRYVLGSLGYKGGLKKCEKALGIDRNELDGVDGFFAVLLWNDFKRNGNEKALETLLAYNIRDTINLETLLVMAYNLKLKETPFLRTHTLPPPLSPPTPFKADEKTIERIRRENYV